MLLGLWTALAPLTCLRPTSISHGMQVGQPPRPTRIFLLHTAPLRRSTARVTKAPHAALEVVLDVRVNYLNLRGIQARLLLPLSSLLSVVTASPMDQAGARLISVRRIAVARRTPQ